MRTRAADRDRELAALANHHAQGFRDGAENTRAMIAAWLRGIGRPLLARGVEAEADLDWCRRAAERVERRQRVADHDRQLRLFGGSR